MKSLKTIQEIYSQRKNLLEKNGYKNYQQYLRSDEWRQIKEKAKTRTAPKWNMCNVCGCKNNLDLHHSSYWVIGHKHPGNTIFPLCRNCHQETHEISKKFPNKNLRFAVRQLKLKLKKEGKPIFWKGVLTITK